MRGGFVCPGVPLIFLTQVMKRRKAPGTAGEGMVTPAMTGRSAPSLH